MDVSSLAFLQYFAGVCLAAAQFGSCRQTDRQRERERERERDCEELTNGLMLVGTLRAIPCRNENADPAAAYLRDHRRAIDRRAIVVIAYSLHMERRN